MREINRSLGANATEEVGVTGDFIHLYASKNSLEIRVGGDMVTMRAGDKQRFDRPFESFVIFNPHATPTDFTVIAGQGDFQDDRIAGTVEVVDGGAARTKNNESYMGAAGVPAVAAQNSSIQLLNPGASPFDLYVSKCYASTDAPSPIILVINNSPLTTLHANSPVNKRIQGSGSVAEVRYENGAGVTTNPIVAMYSGGGTQFEFLHNEPILLEPNDAITVVAQTVNVGLWASFDYHQTER